MPSSTSNSDAGAAALRPCGIVVATLAVLVIETTIFLISLWLGKEDGAVASHRFYLMDHQPTVAESIIQWQVHHMLYDIEAQDVICLGDSSCLIGLRPLPIMQETGLKTWNVGTTAWIGTKGHARLLGLYIERHGPPPALVYYVAYSTLTQTEEETRKLGYFDRFIEWVGPTTGYSELKWLPSLNFRRAVRDWLIPGFLERQVLEAGRNVYPSDAETDRLLLESRGHFVEYSIEKGSQVPRLTGGLTPDAEAGLRTIFQTAGQHGTRILFVLNPIPDIARTRANELVLAELEARLRRIAAEYDNVQPAEPLINYYPDGEFASLTHLGIEGSERVSRFVAGLLKRVQAKSLIDNGRFEKQ